MQHAVRHYFTVLADAGFDIVHPFDAQAAAREPGWEPLAQAGAHGVIVGNTRALWPAFGAALAAEPELASESDPLDCYTERTLTGYPGARAVLYAHHRYGGAYLPFQRLAVAAGLATLDTTHLLVHPIYGTWFALRAVVVLGAERPLFLDEGRPGPSFELPDWQRWLAVRDACPIGREFRYSEEQISYHYTKDRRFLPVPISVDGV